MEILHTGQFHTQFSIFSKKGIWRKFPYKYDSLNRVTAIPGYAQFTYNDSLLHTMTFNNGAVTTYQYDDCHRPVNIKASRNGTDLLLIDYQYDQVGNITQLDYKRRLPDQTWFQSTETFQYDRLDRLTGAEGDYGSLLYSYDPAGNRLSQNGLVYTYSTMNELLSISDGTVFTYDDNGNTLTKSDSTTNWSYTYSGANLLEKVVKDQQIVGEYMYDGAGKRIQKTEWIESLVDYCTIIYTYSGLNPLFEKNPDIGQEALYIYGPMGRIAKKVDGLVNYYHTDHLGSTRLITDESGEVIADMAYTPFGEPLNEQEEPYLFSGKERDASGLYYFGARYYDPQSGRFMTRDPLAGTSTSPQTLNRYVYCANNPLKYADPLGLWFEPDIGEDEEPESPEVLDEEPVLVIELEDGTLLTIDLSGQSGNVLVGYGYITNSNPRGDKQRFQVVFVVILFDDDGNVGNYKTWDKDEMDPSIDREKRDDFVGKMLEVVGDENMTDLVSALDAMQKKAYELSDINVAEAVVGSALVGAVSGFKLGGGKWGAIGGAVIGAVSGLITVGEAPKWGDISQFLTQLIKGFVPKPT